MTGEVFICGNIIDDEMVITFAETMLIGDLTIDGRAVLARFGSDMSRWQHQCQWHLQARLGKPTALMSKGEGGKERGAKGKGKGGKGKKGEEQRQGKGRGAGAAGSTTGTSTTATATSSTAATGSSTRTAGSGLPPDAWAEFTAGRRKQAGK